MKINERVDALYAKYHERFADKSEAEFSTPESLAEALGEIQFLLTTSSPLAERLIGLYHSDDDLQTSLLGMLVYLALSPTEREKLMLDFDEILNVTGGFQKGAGDTLKCWLCDIGMQEERKATGAVVDYFQPGRVHPDTRTTYVVCEACVPPPIR